MGAGADVVFGSFFKANIEHAIVAHVFQCFKGQVRVDTANAIAQQQCHMVYLARLSGFDNNRNTQTGALFNQVMVQSRASQQRRNRSLFLGNTTVGEDEDDLALFNVFIGQSKDFIQGLFQTSATLSYIIQHGNRGSFKIGNMS